MAAAAPPPPPADAGGGTRFVSFGEAMVRFAPVGSGPAKHGRGEPSGRALYVRSVGGDELNVSVALARLGRRAGWVSVLPRGPLGEAVADTGDRAGVDLRGVHYATPAAGDAPDAEVGIFTVLPDEKTVHYQRRHSAFALQRPGLFAWAELLSGGGRTWLHMTGITPSVSPAAATAWAEALTSAASAGVRISMDLNHRPALITLPALWALLSPHLRSLQVLILALPSLRALAELHGVPPPHADAPESDGAWLVALAGLRDALGGPAVAACFKSRDGGGVQTRWSAIAHGGGVVCTADTPVRHVPKDECGGGSAWAAGLLDALGPAADDGAPVMRRDDGTGLVTIDEAVLAGGARRGDLLAALAQEEFGDHSMVTRGELAAAEARWRGGGAVVGTVSGGGSGGAAVVARGVPAGAGIPAALATTLCAVRAARVIAILRARNAEVAIARGLELAELGCRALEVTVDSVDFEHVVSTLVALAGHRCVVGAGTVVTHEDMARAARAGCRFAFSPVHPGGGFVPACHALGMLAVPAAFSPQEVYACLAAGALAVKLFPASLWRPEALRAMLAVGTFGDARIIPSGGVAPADFGSWLDAGAFAVGMGGNLVGEDVRVPPSEPAALEAARAKWVGGGRAAAEATFARAAVISGAQ